MPIPVALAPIFGMLAAGGMMAGTDVMARKQRKRNLEYTQELAELQRQHRFQQNIQTMNMINALTGGDYTQFQDPYAQQSQGPVQTPTPKPAGQAPETTGYMQKSMAGEEAVYPTPPEPPKHHLRTGQPIEDMKQEAISSYGGGPIFPDRGDALPVPRRLRLDKLKMSAKGELSAEFTPDTRAEEMFYTQRFMNTYNSVLGITKNSEQALDSALRAVPIIPDGLGGIIDKLPGMSPGFRTSIMYRGYLQAVREGYTADRGTILEVFDRLGFHPTMDEIAQFEELALEDLTKMYMQSADFRSAVVNGTARLGVPGIPQNSPEYPQRLRELAREHAQEDLWGLPKGQGLAAEPMEILMTDEAKRITQNLGLDYRMLSPEQRANAEELAVEQNLNRALMREMQLAEVRATADDYAAAKKIEPLLDELETLSAGIFTGQGGILNRLWESAKLKAAQASQAGDFGVAVATYAAKSQAYLAHFARYYGERGVLTDQDIERAAMNIPIMFPADAQNVAMNKMRNIRVLIDELEAKVQAKMRGEYVPTGKEVSFSSLPEYEAWAREKWNKYRKGLSGFRAPEEEATAQAPAASAGSNRFKGLADKVK